MFCIVISNTLIFSQQENLDDNRIVAEAGNDKITAEEFKDRFDFSPHPRKSESLNQSTEELIKKETSSFLPDKIFTNVQLKNPQIIP